MKTTFLLAALLCLAPAAYSKLGTPTFAPPAAASGGGPGGEPAEKVLRLQVEGEYAGITHSADFLVENANQSNYVQGGERPFAFETKAGKGVEFKKWGFIVNALPVEDPAHPGRVSLQMQIEISGPVQTPDGIEVRTWQLQTTLHVVKGKPKTVSRGTGKVVVTVTDDAD
jgi:hypothetical protein